MGFTDQDCPVCGNRDAGGGEDPQGGEAVKFWCRTECGMFLMGSWFLKKDWPTVSHEDKKAIATYLKKTKGTRKPQFIISEENYKFHVEEGKILLRRAASSLGTP